MYNVLLYCILPIVHNICIFNLCNLNMYGLLILLLSLFFNHCSNVLLRKNKDQTVACHLLNTGDHTTTTLCDCENASNIWHQNRQQEKKTQIIRTPLRAASINEREMYHQRSVTPMYVMSSKFNLFHIFAKCLRKKLANGMPVLTFGMNY